MGVSGEFGLADRRWIRAVSYRGEIEGVRGAKNKAGVAIPRYGCYGRGFRRLGKRNSDKRNSVEVWFA
jgi:hypothetical protein